MSKQRKTINVQLLKEYANAQLNNPNLSMQEKSGIIIMIEKVLHDANVYKGFMFMELNRSDTNELCAPALDTEGYFTRKYF